MGAAQHCYESTNYYSTNYQLPTKHCQLADSGTNYQLMTNHKQSSPNNSAGRDLLQAEGLRGENGAVTRLVRAGAAVSERDPACGRGFQAQGDPLLPKPTVKATTYQLRATGCHLLFVHEPPLRPSLPTTLRVRCMSSALTRGRCHRV